MRRHLSQTVIIILMILSPLSFSTDKIPNFAPECEVRLIFGEKSGVAVAAIRSLNPSLLCIATGSVTRYAVSPPPYPHMDSLRIPPGSRAPPSPVHFSS